MDWDYCLLNQTWAATSPDNKNRNLIEEYFHSALNISAETVYHFPELLTWTMSRLVHRTQIIHHQWCAKTGYRLSQLSLSKQMYIKLMLHLGFLNANHKQVRSNASRRWKCILKQIKSSKLTKIYLSKNHVTCINQLALITYTSKQSEVKRS